MQRSSVSNPRASGTKVITRLSDANHKMRFPARPRNFRAHRARLRPEPCQSPCKMTESASPLKPPLKPSLNLATPRRGFSPQFLSLLWRVLTALAIFHLAFQLWWWLPLMWNRAETSTDSHIYYQAAVRLKDGLPLYQPWPEYTPQLLPSRFFYPPPFLLLTRPLASLDFLWFSRVWTLLLMLAFWVYAACLSKMATGKVGWKAVLIAGMCINLCPKGYITMAFGNFETVMWACYGLAFSTRFRTAPLAFAMMMKLHPVWTLLLVLQNGGKRSFFVASSVLIAGIGGGLWICGLQNSLNWWPSTSNVVSQGTFWDGNVSVSFALLRVISALGWNYDGGILPLWAKAYLGIVALAAPLLTIYFSRRKPLELRLALTACATILFAPLCWTMYLPLLLSPAAIWIGARHSD